MVSSEPIGCWEVDMSQSQSRRVRSVVLGVAALLGAAAGATVGRARTRACECSAPSWALVLSADPPEGAELEQAGVWPDEAHLEAHTGIVLWTSLDHSTESVDRLQAGSW